MKLRSCPGCNSSYTTFTPNSPRNGYSKRPLLLKCGHTFCESCISQKISKKKNFENQQFVCPICKSITLLPNGIKDLTVNLYLFAQLEVNQISKLELSLGKFVPGAASHKGSRKGASEFFVRKCMVCKTSDASCKCLECDNISCARCFESFHQVSAAIRQHKPVPLLSTQSAAQSTDQNCKEHGRPIEYFCLEDNCAICSRCYIMGNHKDHSIVSYEEKNKELIGEIEVEKDTAQQALRHLEKADDKLASLVPDVRLEMRKIIEDISESFLGVHTLLQVREMELTESLTKVFTDMCASLEEKRESFSLQRFDLEAAVKDAKMLIENNALIIDSTFLLEKLKAGRAAPCIIVKKDQSESSLFWNEAGKEDLALAMKSFGSISGNALDTVEFLSLEEAPPGYIEEDNDDRVSVASSTSTSCKEKPYRRASTVDSSEGVIIENDTSDADSDVTRGSRPKSQASVSLYSSKEPFQESLTMPVIKGRPQKVTVTHICSPNDFLVQLISNKRKLETLSHNINTWCRREVSARHTPSKVEVGSLVLARYHVDRTWYRARVLGLVEGNTKSQNSSKVHVQYIDYGNEEVVPLKELRNMEKRFMIYPVFAVRCSLSDVAPCDEQILWSGDVNREFQKMTEDQTFLLSAFAKENGVYEVDLVCIPNEDVLDDGFVSLRDMLVFLELATFRVHSTAAKHLPTPPSFPKVEFIKPTSVKSGTTVDVIMTSVDSPSSFHITCQGDEHAYYLNMLDEMQEMYSKDAVNLYSLFYPRLNTVCSVQAKDGVWYRGKVVSPPRQRQVTVHLVDIGSTLVVGCGRIKKLHAKFIKLPAQAIHCCLADVAPSSGEWTDKAKHWCRKTMTRAVGIARMKRWEDPAELVLWLGSKVSAPANQSINFLLVEMGFARSTGLSSVGAAQESLYESGGCVGPGRQAQRGRTGSTRGVGPSVTSSSDSRHTPKVSDQTGSSSSASSVADSPTPGKASKPAVEDVRPAAVTSEVNREPKAKKSIKSKKGKAGPKGSGEKRSSVNPERESMLEKEKVQKDIQRAMSSDGAGGDDNSGSIYIEVIISCFESPSDFVLRVKDREEKLETLMGKMQEEYKDSTPSAEPKWKVGDFCAIKCSDDELWYRGKIKTCEEGDESLVEMVDYGYEEVVTFSELRPLAKALGQYMECAAVRCHIANLMPAGSVDIMKWSRTAVEFVKNETKDRSLYIKQEGDVNDLGLPIDIIVATEIPETAFEPAMKMYHSLRQAILDQGLAMPIKRQSQPPTPDKNTTDPFQRVIFEAESLAHQTAAEPDIMTTAVPPDTDLEVPQDVNVSSDGLDTTIVAGETSVKKVPADTLILPNYPALTVGEPLEVFPTFVDKEGIIFVQPKEWEDMIIHLDCELQRVYGSQASAVPNIEWSLEQLCVAYYPADDRWYRALILELLEGGNVKVRYIDYGNSEIVKQSDLREIILEFANVHPLALYCELDDVVPSSLDGRWPVPILEYTHELIVNTWCHMTIVRLEEKPLIQVDLALASGLNLAEHLVDQGMASRVSDLGPEYERSRRITQVLASNNPFASQELGEPGEMFVASLTHVELPNLVYMQRVRMPDTEEVDFVKSGKIASINSMIDDFEKMTLDLNTSNSMPFSHLPDVGCMCAAKYMYDDVWYRALCVEGYKNKGTCLVLYVDFGTSEVVPLDRLRLLPSEFWSLPAQALRIYFNIIPPSGPAGLWRRDSINGVIQALACKEVVVRVTQVEPLTAELLVEEAGEMRLAYESLIKAGLALLPESVEAWKILAPRDDGGEDVVIEGAERGQVVNGSSKVRSSKGAEKKVDWWGADKGKEAGEQCEIDASIDSACAPIDSACAPIQGKENEQGSSDGCSSDDWTTDDDDDDAEDNEGKTAQLEREKEGELKTSQAAQEEKEVD